MSLERLTDDQLLKQTAEARLRAHNAPKSDVGNTSDAWARWSNEWMRLANEVDRRGLTQPMMVAPAETKGPKVVNLKAKEIN